MLFAKSVIIEIILGYVFYISINPPLPSPYSLLPGGALYRTGQALVKNREMYMKNNNNVVHDQCIEIKKQNGKEKTVTICKYKYYS